MDIIMLLFAPLLGGILGPIGINQAIRGILDKLYEGLDSFLDNIGLED